MEFVYIPVRAERLLEVYRLLATEPVEPSTIEDSTIRRARPVTPPTDRPKRRHRVSVALVERSKPCVKRLPQPFTAMQLEAVLKVHQTTTNTILNELKRQGWVEVVRPYQNAQTPTLFKYVPAPEAPQPKREDDPTVTGRGRVNGKGAAPVAGTARKDTPKGEIGTLVNTLRQQGWTVDRTRGGHYRARKNGQQAIFAATPSDPHAVANARADLRRKGANV